MTRMLVSGLVVCLVLAACGGDATPDPDEVARLVDQAVKATISAMPTPEPQTREVEKIVKETVIVERPVELTVIVEVEKEVVVTATPEPATATPTRVPTQTPTPKESLLDLEISAIEYYIKESSLGGGWRINVLATVTNPNIAHWAPPTKCEAVTYDENGALVGISSASAYMGPGQEAKIVFIWLELQDDGVLDGLEVTCDSPDWKPIASWPAPAFEVVQAHFRRAGKDKSVVGQIMNVGEIDVADVDLLIVLRSTDGVLQQVTTESLWESLDVGVSTNFQVDIHGVFPDNMAPVEVYPSADVFSTLFW